MSYSFCFIGSFSGRLKMKINRLFEIVYMLMQREGITAKILAEHFEVSTRTIYRDIETLCEAGIPIYMQQGKGGGIALMDHFVLDKSVLLKEEQEALLGVLEILKVVPESEEILRRVGTLFGEHTKSWLSIDFSEWGSSSNDYFLQIKEAILKQKIIQITYYSGQGDKSKRLIAPLQLCFKHRNWYLKAYCYEKKAIRLFKLGRIKDLEVTANYFDKAIETCLEAEENEQTWEVINMPIICMIHANLAYRVYEEFDDKQIEKQADGSFKVTLYYPENEWLYGYLLSFGPGLEVVAPYQLQRVLRNRAKKILETYEKYDR